MTMGRPKGPAPVERNHASEPMTLEECGQCLGLTKEAIRKIENRVLVKAARYLHERRIGAGDLLGDEVGEAASVLASMGAMSRNMRR